MKREHFEVGETAVTIVAEEEYQEAARASIFRSRETIQSFIRRDPLFKVTLEPYPCPGDAPALIARMCASALKANVGPMAAVAGAIAERAVMDMRDAGATQAIVDNGGDVALLLDRETSIGLYAGERIKSLGFLCPPRDGVFGICTSSATIGPSISFGVSDAATVIAADVTLADACATRLGNLLTSDEDEVMRSALDDICSIPRVEGAVAVVGDKVAMKGSVPKLTRVNVPAGKVSKIEFPGP
jgi:ApbE superfamily uncharacterized protein (UPF0280 family)